LIFSNLFVTTAGDIVRTESHVFGLLHDGRTLSSILVTEGLVLTVGVPVIVVLIMSVVLVERVVEVTI
jgi:hypothetical protein